MKTNTENHILSTYTCTNEDANIEEYPPIISLHQHGTTVVKGDLHGNTLNLLYFLIREGVLDISKEVYSELVNIYKAFNSSDCDRWIKKLNDYLSLKGSLFYSESFYQSELVKYTKFDREQVENRKIQLAHYLDILKDIKLTGTKIIVKLLGDDLADRGNSDLLTLLLYQRLDLLGLEFKVIVSNHTNEFLRQYAYGLHEQDLYISEVYQEESNLRFVNSLIGLRKDLFEDIIELEMVEEFVEVYLRHLLCLDYEVINQQQMLIYSHAPITEIGFRNLMIDFGSNYPDDIDVLRSFSDAKEVAAAIDEINLIFSQNILQNLRIFFMEEDKYPAYYRMTGNRYQDITALFKKDMMNDCMTVNVSNIHGHVGSEKQIEVLTKHWIYANLDTCFGKDSSFKNGVYSSLIYYSDSPEIQLLEMMASEFNSGM